MTAQGTCYLRRGCAGQSFPGTDINFCRDVLSGISFLDGNGCTNYPIRKFYFNTIFITFMFSLHPGFGWTQTTLVGNEQRQDYYVNVGFLEGQFPQQLDVNVEAIYHTANNYLCLKMWHLLGVCLICRRK